MSTIGKRIHQRRTELGLSQRDLASEGVSYAYISRLEADERHPSIRALRQLAPKLGVSAHWLETGEHDPAERLAQLVLEHRGQPLPPNATALARKVLKSPR
jgi:transcriptional regulator with XRE-family HTH domain